MGHKARPKSKIPKPGTVAALALNCSCPVMDNCYGLGWHGNPDMFVYTQGCTVHCPESK